jgi:hypothetical protein
MDKDKNITLEGLEALRQRFHAHSRKAQAYYTVMHKYREIVRNDDIASSWMEASLPAFNGKKPAELVNEGRAEEVLVYIDSLKPNSAA